MAVVPPSAAYTLRARHVVGLSAASTQAADRPFIVAWCVTPVLREVTIFVCIAPAVSLIEARSDVNADASSVLAAASDGHVAIFDCLSMKTRSTLGTASGASLRDASFAPSSPYVLISGHSDGDVNVWDVRTQAATLRLPCAPTVTRMDDGSGEAGVYAVASSAAGDLLAVGSMSEIQLYDMRMTGGARCLGAYVDSHTGVVAQLTFHPVVPHHLISAGDDGLACIFDLSVRGEADALVTVMNAGSGVARMGLFAPQAALAWIITRTDTLSLWNLGSAQRVADFPMLKMQLMEAGQHAHSLVACHYDDESEALSLLCSSSDGQLTLMDVTATAVSHRCDLPHSHSELVRCAAWARVASVRGAGPDGVATRAGTLFFTGSEDTTLCGWGDAGVANIVPAAADRPVKSGVTRRAARYTRRPGAGMDADVFASRSVIAGTAVGMPRAEDDVAAASPSIFARGLMH